MNVITVVAGNYKMKEDVGGGVVDRNASLERGSLERGLTPDLIPGSDPISASQPSKMTVEARSPTARRQADQRPAGHHWPGSGAAIRRVGAVCGGRAKIVVGGRR